MTNYEYLMQNMTLEEFARDRTTCDECPQGGRDKCDKKCMEHMLAWLKAEHLVDADGKPLIYEGWKK